MQEITIPTRLNDQRVAAVFPIIGVDRFVEAEVILTDDANAPTFTVGRFVPREKHFSGGFTVRRYETSFPKAIREARKNAGWG